MPENDVQKNSQQTGDDFANRRPEELHKQGQKIARAIKDLSNNHTDLGQSQEQAKDAKQILRQVKSEQDFAPALREVVLNKIREAVQKKYHPPQSDQMFGALAERVGKDGVINIDDLDEFDWQMLKPRDQDRLDDLGVAPDRVAPLPAKAKPPLKQALAEKYQGVRNNLEGLVQGQPNVPTLPENPEEVDQVAPEEARMAPAPDRGIPVQQGLARPAEVQAAPKTAVKPIQPAPLDIQSQLQETRRQAKRGVRAQQFGSGHWQEQAEQPKTAVDAAGPPRDQALPSGRMPQRPGGKRRGARPQMPRGMGDLQQGGEGWQDAYKAGFASQRRKDKKGKHQQIMQNLPAAIAAGQIGNLAEIPGAAGMKDENNENLDLDQNLADYTGDTNEDQALESSEKELDSIEQEEAQEPEAGAGQDKKAAQQQYNRKARQAKLAAGLQKIIQKHKSTNWFILFAVAAFRELLSWLEFGILVIFFAPIKFFCQLYKKIVLAGKETSTDNAVGWMATITESIPFVDYIPAALLEIIRIYAASRQKMVKAQLQLERIQRNKEK